MRVSFDVMGDPSVQLDIENHGALLAYLRDTGRVMPDAIPTMRTLVGGVSNRTVLVEHADGQAWVLKQALAKLRVAVDWFSDPIRIEREAAGLRTFGRLLPEGCVPRVIFEDQPLHLLAMSAVPQPHENYKTLLLRGVIDDEPIVQFATMLGQCHRLSSQQRAEYAATFADRSFFESLRIEPYYMYTAEQEPRAATFIASLITRTRQRQLALVHGDYSPKNVLIHQGRVVLLDYEVIHFGDPAFDVGFAMTHYLSKAHHMPDYRERLLEAAALFWQTYAMALGDVTWAVDHEPMAVSHTLGCLLARVCGRSPLEYLDDEARSRQRRAVADLMQHPPRRMAELIDDFAKRITD